MTMLPEHLTDITEFFWRPDPSAAAIAARDSDGHTLVTGFFDLGRDRWLATDGRPSNPLHNVENYMERFGYLAKIPNPMIVFTEPCFAERVLDIRRQFGLENLTTILTIEDLFRRQPLANVLALIAERMFNPYFQRMLRAPNLPEFRQPNYILTVSLKPVMVRTALMLGLVATRNVSWIDFGYCREDGKFDASRPWSFDTGGKINLFHGMILDDIPIFSVVRTGEMYFCAHHMMGPREAWSDYADQMAKSFECLVECGLVDDEQTAMFMSVKRHPDKYILHPLASKQWFSTLRPPEKSEAATSVKLPSARNISLNRPVWVEELIYAIDRSTLKADLRRMRRGLKSRIRRLFKTG